MQVAVLGASGLVGRTMLGLLESCAWVDHDPWALTSLRSAGARIPFRGRELVCKEVSSAALAGCDVLLCSAGSGPARQWGPLAASGGALVVDNSSGFRQDENIPLVVPEVNPAGTWTPGQGGRIIANPNCSTIQIAVFAAVVQAVCGLTELHAVTLQAVSGAGQKAVDEWRAQEAGADTAPRRIFPRVIAANVLPAIGPVQADGSYEEEAKVGRELRKILGRGTDLKVSCTAVRVPVHTGHSAALRCLLPRPLDLAALQRGLASGRGLEVQEDPHGFATPLETAGSTVVRVGRLRADPDNPEALLAWVVADNLLKGAAWNAVQIVESCLGKDAERRALR